MLQKSDAAKRQIIRTLGEEGYATYARLVDYFTIYLTDDPKHIAYVMPGRAVIVLNKGLSIDQVSTLVRHEILHEFFNHMKRKQEVETEHPELGSDHQLSNIAGDFDISNRGYTKRDKIVARGIRLGDESLQGLVTELDEPGWENKSFAEMYQLLLERKQQNQKMLQQLMERIAQLNPDNLDDIEQQLDDAEKQCDNSNDCNIGSPNQDAAGEAQQGQGKKTPGSVDKKDIDQAKKDLDKIKDAAQDIKQDDAKDAAAGNPIDSAEEQKRKADLAKRVAEIKRLLNDVNIERQAYAEVERNKQKETRAIDQREAERYRQNPLSKFKLALNKFIASQIEEEEHETYARINPSYEDSEFIIPGKITTEHKYIPRVNVYWDVSGSFFDPRKTEGARRAIATVNQYVRNGDITVDMYYFSDRVSNKRSDVGGGTLGTPIQDNIDQTKPDNVIIITDADISDCRRVTQVPGAVWMLFYDGESPNLIDHIKGKRETRHYLILDY